MSKGCHRLKTVRIHDGLELGRPVSGPATEYGVTVEQHRHGRKGGRSRRTPNIAFSLLEF